MTIIRAAIIAVELCRLRPEDAEDIEKTLQKRFYTTRSIDQNHKHLSDRRQIGAEISNRVIGFVRERRAVGRG